jgi:hypothetical protein
VHFVGFCCIALSCPSVRPFFCLCICPAAWNKSFTTGRIFMKFDIWIFFLGKLSRKFIYFIKIRQEWSVLCRKTYVHWWEHLIEFFLGEMLQTRVFRENQNMPCIDISSIKCNVCKIIYCLNKLLHYLFVSLTTESWVKYCEHENKQFDVKI